MCVSNFICYRAFVIEAWLDVCPFQLKLTLQPTPPRQGKLPLCSLIYAGQDTG